MIDLNSINMDDTKLITKQENDKIISSLKYQKIPAVKHKITHTNKYIPLFNDVIYQKPIILESRRYIGNKAKISDWIMNLIEKETENVQIFTDIFAGTATISARALSKYKKVIINDFLYSNNIIYKAFFQKGQWNKDKLNNILTNYNLLNPKTIEENYFSENFGGKFYEKDVSKLIGYIRQNIEDIKYELTEKEYNILLATLIYNIDKIANTVGHFDAYIKKPIKYQSLQMRMIDVKDFDNVEIYKEDANILSRKINSDLVYIDPPYNSRQYCRFYHLYETLIKWDKPLLHGVALKPNPENMSAYCTVKARNRFEDLIRSLNARYLVVSYNNTYDSKSNSSKNKIKLEEIADILNRCGETKQFECSHSFFNTGKTEFNDHKELLFITKVDEKRKNKSFAPLLCWG
ncbi:MAG: DNA adenine methylase [Bacteroidales bacterium]|jgi:adenine-specific DNA-methyltransferase|nr:DNA adenine methylase [Bacteroidales bacterium]